MGRLWQNVKFTLPIVKNITVLCYKGSQSCASSQAEGDFPITLENAL